MTARAVVLSALVLATMLGPVPALADAGRFTHIVCADPTTGLGVGHADGLSTPASFPSWKATVNDATCARQPMSTARAITLSPRAAVAAPAGGFAAVAYTVTDPALALRGARYFRALTVLSQPSDVRADTLQHGNADPAVYAGGNLGEWRHMVPEHSRGTPDLPFSPANEVPALVGARGFTVTVKCNRWDGGECAHDPGQWSYRFFGGEAELEDLRAPEVEWATGTLTAATVVGDAAVTFAARDTGAGLYRVRLTVDGRAREHRTVSAAPASCADARPATADPHEFTLQRPCADSTVETLRLDTRTLPDGPHRVVATIEDAGGNLTTVLDRTVEVRNAAPPPATTGHQDTRPHPAPVQAIAAPAPGPAAFGSPGPIPHPGARLTLQRTGPRTDVPFTAPVALRGRLVDKAGHPIAEAQVVLTVRHARPGAPWSLVATVTTRRDGTFTASAPGGPSQTLTATHGAARASVRTRVRAQVSLDVGPARVGRATWLTGRLRHLPRAGVLVQVQALDGRRWRTFDTTKTRADGRYRYAYRFKAPARGRRFALRVLVDSPLYPFQAAPSSPRWVLVR